MAVENEKLRTLLAKFSADLAVFDVFSKSDVCIAAECSRLFVPVEAYNLFNCRMRLLRLSYARLNAMQLGLDARKLGDDNNIIEELCNYMPDIADKIRKLRQLAFPAAFDMLKILALRALQANLYTNTSPAQVLNTAEMFDKLQQEKQQQTKANGYG